jgi:beta-phosphoglucomutase family hydrolase
MVPDEGDDQEVTQKESSQVITREKYDAVLFDLDGVLTDTANLHAACWKKMFDAFLQRHAKEKNIPFQPFDIGKDYRQYVDGKLRYEGVRSFLESRGIHLPYGDPNDPPGYESITGLGNIKDRMVNEALRSGGVEVYEGSLSFLRHLRRQGFKTAVVSASKNCRAVLQAAGIEDLFDARVDGEVAARLSLPGKPSPDTFLEAAKELGSRPERAVVVEDALSGIQAGRDGGFGLVVGIEHHGNRQALEAQGADIVVSDLSELIRTEDLQK